MEEINKKLKTLASLEKKAEELDKKLTDIRVEINNLFWDTVEIKKRKN